MIRSGTDQTEAIERAPGIYENQGMGSSYLVTTSAGNVLVNAGCLSDARHGKVIFDKVSAVSPDR